MWKGQLAGTLDLDTITNKKNLYGLGPLEGLRGELMIIDGIAYKSTVLSETQMEVNKTYKAKAPFFVYGYAEHFKSTVLPKSVKSLSDLEDLLDDKTKTHNKPFLFVLKGTINNGFIHVVNLPEGSKVSSPQEAHKGQVDYHIDETEVEIVGFFSRSHQSVFTHHDTFMHLHLITKDGSMMGHLDRVEFKEGEMTLYLPNN